MEHSFKLLSEEKLRAELAQRESLAKGAAEIADCRKAAEDLIQEMQDKTKLNADLQRELHDAIRALNDKTVEIAKLKDELAVKTNEVLHLKQQVDILMRDKAIAE